MLTACLDFFSTSSESSGDHFIFLRVDDKYVRIFCNEEMVSDLDKILFSSLILYRKSQLRSFFETEEELWEEVRQLLVKEHGLAEVEISSDNFILVPKMPSFDPSNN